MTIGMVGLGRMGGNMARRMARSGLDVVAWDRAPGARAGMSGEERVRAVETLQQFIDLLPAPRVVWMMLPAGEPTQQAVDALSSHLTNGDILVDGANAWYRDSIARAEALAGQGVAFVDAGVSGGVWGLESGYGLMLGGTPEAVRALEPFLGALAPAADRGWLHCGGSGAGHFAKMVHNGIEYGLMQAYAEGFALLRAKDELQLDVPAIAEAWRHGTVIRSWLLDLTAQILAEDGSVSKVAPVVADSGEGRWAASEAIELGVPAPVISLSVMERFASQGQADFKNRLLARMRQAFGGHAVKRAR